MAAYDEKLLDLGLPGARPRGWGLMASARWHPLPMGSPPMVGCIVSCVVVNLQLQKLALGTWNVISAARMEAELVCEVEKFWLDIVRLTSAHGPGSGASLPERGWTLPRP